jgi:predicted permease
MSGLFQDIRYAVRQLRKNPAFTAVVVLTLALGIGANTAIFSLLNAVLLRSLPVREPQQLMLFGKGTARGSTDGLPNDSCQLFSYPFFREFRHKNEVFSGVAAIDSILFTTHGRIGESSSLENVSAELVSGTYFNVLGVNPILGRTLAEADDQTPGGHPVAVASYSWWQRRFGKDPNIVGKTVTIRSTAYALIGVAPPEFFGVTVGQSPDVWIPLMMEKEISPGWNGVDNNLFQSLYIVARRKSHISIEQASADTNLLFKQILREYVGPQPSPSQLEDIQHARIDLTPAATGLSHLRNEFSSPLKILMAVVGLVLLVACANVANLLLARATSRQREIAVRMSMGATRTRLIRQSVVESMLLAAVGLILGVWLAWWAAKLLLAMVSAEPEPLPLRVTPDFHVLGFTLLIAALTVLLFGIAPAFRATQLEMVPSLKEGRGTTASRSHNRLANSLIIGQVALSLVLLVGASLFLRSLVNLTNVDTGFNKQNVLMTSMDPVGAGYQENADWESTMQRIEEQVNALPGVRASSFAFFVFEGGGWTTGIRVPGRASNDDDPDVDHDIVGSAYFEAMGMPMVLGRGLLPKDSATSQRVAVINQTMARVYFGNESPLGHSFSVGDQPGGNGQRSEWENIEVVGVVRDAKYMDLDEKPIPAAFYPHSQHPKFPDKFIARYNGDSKALSSAISAAVKEIDPHLPVGTFTTLAQQVDNSVLNRRLVTELCSFFAILAVLLACIGIYGLMSYGVSRRTNEFGVRLALGADRGRVVWLVLRQTLELIGIGVGVGMAIAPPLNRLVKSFLFGLGPYDVASIGSAITAMTVVALFAGYLPARRAAKVDPMVALRYE